MSTNGRSHLEEIVSRIDAALQAIKESVSLGSSTDDGARRLAAAGVDQAASGAQMLATMDAIALVVEQAAASAHDLMRSQQTVSEAAHSVQQGVEANAAALTQMSASI